MNNLKFIILDYLAAKNLGFELTQRFLQLVQYKQYTQG